MPRSHPSRPGDTHGTSAAYAASGPAPAMRAGGVLADGGDRIRRDFVGFTPVGRPPASRLSGLDVVPLPGPAGAVRRGESSAWTRSSGPGSLRPMRGRPAGETPVSPGRPAH